MMTYLFCELRLGMMGVYHWRSSDTGVFLGNVRGLHKIPKFA